MIYTPLTKKAMKIAYQAHRNQTDKSGIPYIFHVVHLAEQMDDQYTVCAALLHDVIEDTAVTYDDLRREGFPETVINAIAQMTRDDSVPYLKYIRRMKSNPVARKVKLADLKHNCDLSRMDEVSAKDIERVEKYQQAIALLESDENPNITILSQTLEALERGSFLHNGTIVTLKTTICQMKEAKVFLPDDIERLCGGGLIPQGTIQDSCETSCKNMDSYTMAREIVRDPHRFGEGDRILVLNFANPVNIGGGVRRGARAQEEDLCRQSSLLLSLESDEAAPYYRYNRSLHTMMGSDAMIISPTVEIVRDGGGRWLDDTDVVSVLTCAAPYIRDGFEGMTFDEYRAMMAHRIRGILYCSASEGYTHLVLGAWGCGAFGNDPKLIAQLFDEELRRFSASGKNSLKRVDFAVLSRSPGMYNYKVFAKVFNE